jgi:hypothetical protein
MATFKVALPDGTCRVKHHVAGYLTLNKGRLTDAAPAAISQAGREQGTIPTERGTVMTPATPANSVGTNAATVTNAPPLSATTNTWERVTAGQYADLIKEIRNARGNAQ